MNQLLELELIELHEEYQGFQITDQGGVNWAFRKLKSLVEKKKEIEMVSTEEIARIEAWKIKETESLNDSITFFEGHLKAFYESVKKEDSKAKVSSPWGKVTSRKSKKWNYVDEGKLLDYLITNEPDLVRVKEEINKAELKKQFKEGINTNTGEVIPGIEIIEEESISIKVD